MEINCLKVRNQIGYDESKVILYSVNVQNFKRFNTEHVLKF